MSAEAECRISAPRVIALDCSATPGFECTVLRMFCGGRRGVIPGMELWLASLNSEALELVQPITLAEYLEHERMFFTVEQAVAFEAGC